MSVQQKSTVAKNWMNVKKTVRKIIATKIKKDMGEVTLIKDFARDLGVDSLTFAELTMEFEENFGLESITQDEADKFQTVGDVIEYLNNILLQKYKNYITLPILTLN